MEEILELIDLAIEDYRIRSRQMTDDDIMNLRADLSSNIYRFYNDYFPKISLKKAIAMANLEIIEKQIEFLEANEYDSFRRQLEMSGISISKADDISRKAFKINQSYQDKVIAFINQKISFTEEVALYWNYDKIMDAAKSVLHSMGKRKPWQNE